DVTAPNNYSVTVTNDDNGCFATSPAITITEDKTAPTATITSTTTVLTCVITSITISASTDAVNASYLWSNGETTPSIDVTLPDTYSVQITNNDNGCSTISNQIIITDGSNKPTATITSTATEITCQITSITISASTDAVNASYLWSTGEINSYIEVTEAGTYSVQITNNDNSCSQISNEIIITDSSDRPSATITTTGTELTCAISSITLTAETDAANVMYYWSTTESTSSIEVSGAGDYTVTITNLDNHCSSTSLPVEITENKVVPLANVTSSATELTCTTTSITLTASTDVTNASYLWSTNETTSEIDVTTAGNYSVEVTNEDNGCSTISLPVSITEDKVAPTATISSTETVLTCIRTSITLTAVTNATNASYLWEDGSAQISFDATSTGNYSVEITNNDNGCSTTSNSIVITEDVNKPVAAIQSLSTIITCDQTSIDLQALTDAVNASYLWSEGSVDPAINVNAAGNYTVTVTNTDNGCSSISLPIEITENTKIPDVQINSSNSELNCIVHTITLSAITDAVNPSYLWNDGSYNEDLLVSAAGIYSVSVTDQVNGCSFTSGPVNITENTVLPTAAITSLETELTCLITSITLTAVTDAVNPEYEWSNGSNLASLSVDAAGNYTVTVTNLNNGCETTSLPITITSDIIVPQISLQVIDPVCSPETVNLSDAVLSSDADNIHYYEDAALQQEVTDLLISIPGEYRYYIVGENNNGCKSIPQSVSIGIYELQVSNFVSANICAGETVVLWAEGTGPQADMYVYNIHEPGDVLSGNKTDNRFEVNVTPYQTTTYSLSVVNGVCQYDADMNVLVWPLPSFTVEQTDPQTATLNMLDVSESPYVYMLDGTEMLFDTDPPYVFTVNAGDHEMYVSDVNGCENVVEFFVDNSKMPIMIPKFFSPNDDGQNDTWEIGNIDYYPNALIQIYDRYHKLLIEYKGSDRGWDGTYRGHQMPSTDYWYLIKIPELGKPQVGHFSLLRGKI
ncbi:MAG: T9SS type B sorting domain-containing protein, partial [Bacteroidia bacterium]|nr:T9SS type B sorting domain-containing protein [Bacteroidia bacterium]